MKKSFLDIFGALKNIWQESKGQPQEADFRSLRRDIAVMPDDTRHFESDASFQAWFKGSKVRNENGSPLIVAHATSSHIDNFFPYSHFGTLAAAEDIARKGRSGHSPVIYPVVLDIKNPIEIEDRGNHPIDMYCEVLQGMGVLTATEVAEMRDMPAPYPHIPGMKPYCENYYPNDCAIDMIETHQTIFKEYVQKYEDNIRELQDENFYSSLGWNPHNVRGQRLAKKLLDKGYDGFKYINEEEDAGSVSWTILHHCQVRSALDGQPFRADRETFKEINAEKLEGLINEREKIWRHHKYSAPNVFMEPAYLNHQKTLDMFERIIENRRSQKQDGSPAP